jgi:succinate dehydrogenase/fumarate reductase-like Fe-S protein
MQPLEPGREAICGACGVDVDHDPHTDDCRTRTPGHEAEFLP